jgi:hypothetical protein
MGISLHRPRVATKPQGTKEQVVGIVIVQSGFMVTYSPLGEVTATIIRAQSDWRLSLHMILEVHIIERVK